MLVFVVLFTFHFILIYFGAKLSKFIIHKNSANYKGLKKYQRKCENGPQGAHDLYLRGEKAPAGIPVGAN
ncbi:hypothetical protein BWD42_09160 [Sphingobacterium sp. CZ-UAM]|nr:hypothetical protein BWD42_09160 [Sphingobacterium sp. CZ-UAM]